MRANEFDERSELARPTEKGRRGLRQLAGQAQESVALALQRDRIGHHEAVGGDRVQLQRLPDVLEPETTDTDQRDIVAILELLAGAFGNDDATGDGKRFDARREVDGIAAEPLRLDNHFANVDADTHWDCGASQIALYLHRRLHGRQRAREHAHCAVAEPLDDRPAERLVVALDGRDKCVTPVQRPALVSLDQRGVADHIGKHHRDEPAIEPLLHASSCFKSDGLAKSQPSHVEVRNCVAVRLASYWPASADFDAQGNLAPVDRRSRSASTPTTVRLEFRLLGSGTRCRGRTSLRLP